MQTKSNKGEIESLKERAKGLLDTIEMSAVWDPQSNKREKLSKLTQEYIHTIGEIWRLLEIEAIEPKQPAPDVYPPAGIYLYSMHDKEPFKNPENHCIIAKDTVEHLLNCLDNQKFNPPPGAQKTIDETNYMTRVALKMVHQRDEPRGLTPETNGQQNDMTTETDTQVITQQSVKALMSIRDKAKQLLRELQDGSNRPEFTDRFVKELNTALWEYHAAGGGL